MHVDFIQGFLRIRGTIKKSKLFCLPMSTVALMQHRIILAGIRDRGLCPCPRCLIPKSRLQNMGMPLDMKQRETLARVDDEARRRKVGIARDIIYKKNYAVDSDAVEAILKEESLVPNKVSLQL
jgi:hypothetical protein